MSAILDNAARLDKQRASDLDRSDAQITPQVPGVRAELQAALDACSVEWSSVTFGRLLIAARAVLAGEQR